MTVFIVLAVSTLFAGICHVMAAQRGRSPSLWATLGFCFGPIPVLVLAVLGKVDRNGLPAH